MSAMDSPAVVPVNGEKLFKVGVHQSLLNWQSCPVVKCQVVGLNRDCAKIRIHIFHNPHKCARVLVSLFTHEAVIVSDLAKLQELVHRCKINKFKPTFNHSRVSMCGTMGSLPTWHQQFTTDMHEHITHGRNRTYIHRHTGIVYVYI